MSNTEPPVGSIRHAPPESSCRCLPLALAFIMLVFGLGLTFDDFVRVALRPRDFAVGAASHPGHIGQIYRVSSNDTDVQSAVMGFARRASTRSWC